MPFFRAKETTREERGEGKKDKIAYLPHKRQTECVESEGGEMQGSAQGGRLSSETSKLERQEPLMQSD